MTTAYRFSRIGEMRLILVFEVRTGNGVAAEGEVVHGILCEDDRPRPVPET